MITLEDMKFMRDKLAVMIAACEQPPVSLVTIPQPHLNAGERYVGTIVSADDSCCYSLILLPDAAEPADWETQMKWAESIGGELPDRVEGAFLFSTMKDEFRREVYWTRERPADAGWAWYQCFEFGGQDGLNVRSKLRARAVRREIH